MASGFNGQQFVFHGYLPIDKNLRSMKLKTMEADVVKNNYSHIFIETPYRNNQMLQDMITTLHQATLLCVAVDIEGEGQLIKTMTMNQWKNKNTAIEKSPAVFIIGR